MQSEHGIKLANNSFGRTSTRSRLVEMARSRSVTTQNVTECVADEKPRSRISDSPNTFDEAPLPDWLEEVVSHLPTNVNRRRGAEEISHHLFPVSHRSLEAWPLPTRRVNGQAIFSTRDLFVLAFRKYSASPIVMGGRRNTSHPR
jgi:hypothetical protein